ncbi:hypothetical protein GJAV_G00062250 [Gymnothorax javanicus]|nr:hypothetical protein GJAV_G00062250 [Gymnothorax javanicus]
MINLASVLRLRLGFVRGDPEGERGACCPQELGWLNFEANKLKCCFCLGWITKAVGSHYIFLEILPVFWGRKRLKQLFPCLIFLAHCKNQTQNRNLRG